MAYASAEDSSEIYYEVHGSRGTAVLMAAGMGGSGRFWQLQVDALAQRHRVVLYDQVGTGSSSRKMGVELSVARMARDMLAVLNAQGLSAAHVVGHAIGGIIGLSLAACAPARVLSLTVINAWAQADAHLKRCFEVRKDILQHSGPLAYLRAQPLFLYPPRWISDNDAYLNDELSGQLAAFPATSTMLNRINLFLNFDAMPLLPLVHTPCLIMAARDDALVPCHLSNALQAALPTARLEIIDSGAHAFTHVHPERFSELLLSYLAEHDPSFESSPPSSS